MINSGFRKPYIIAETAYNHEGNLRYLYRMIDEISTLHINAIKFHLLLDPESYMTKNHPLFPNIKKWIFSTKQWDKIINYTNKKGLDIITLCDDVESIKYITKNKKKIQAIELHATSLNDYFMLTEASQFLGQVFLGTGGSSLDEICYAIDLLKLKQKNDLVLMYGFQSYPTNYPDVNLSKMIKLRDLFKLPVGYADHTRYDDPNNELISIAAAMMGFWILEKHYTLDYGKKRIDYHAAVGKKQMKKIKELMKIALSIHNNGNLAMSKPEKAYGNIGPMKKAIVAKRDIKKGEKLSLNNMWFKRTSEESTVKQNQLLLLNGCRTKCFIKKDEIIDFSKVNYKFKTTDVRNFINILGPKWL